MNTRPSKRTSYRWPVIIIGMLVAHVVMMMFAVSYAVQGHATAGITPDYYQKALDWDATRAQQRINESLGWRIALTPGMFLDANDQRELKIHITDAQGQAITGAQVNAQAYHAIYPKTTNTTCIAIADPSGHYTGTLALTRPGLWLITLTVERGSDVYVQTLEQRIAAFTREPGA